MSKFSRSTKAELIVFIEFFIRDTEFWRPDLESHMLNPKKPYFTNANSLYLGRWVRYIESELGILFNDIDMSEQIAKKASEVAASKTASM
jgi:hypothetical protein